MWKKGRKSHYYKFFFSFILILLVPVLTILLIFFQTAATVKEQIEVMNRNTLNYFFQYVDSAIEGAVNTSTSIAFGNQYSNLSKQFVSQPKKRSYYAWMLIKQLQEYKNEKYHDIFVYYPGQDYVISATGAGCSLEDYYNFYYADLGDFYEEFCQVAESSMKKPVLYSMNGKGRESYQCVALRTGVTRNANQEYIVVIVLNRNYMSELLQGVEQSNENGISFILNADREVIYSTEDGVVSQAVDVYQETESVYECYIGEEKCMMLSRASGQMDVFYTYAMPYSYFLSKLYYIYVIFLLGLLISIVLGILVAYWQTNKIYRPFGLTIKRLQDRTVSKWDAETSTEFEFIEKLFNREMKEKHKMNAVMKQEKEARRKNFIISMFNNEVIFSQTIDDVFAENGILLCSDNFCVVLLQAEEIAGLEKGLFSFILSNVLEELLAEKCRGYVVPMEANRNGVLVNLDGQCDGVEDIAKLIENGMFFLEKHWHLKFTVGISTVQQGMLGISVAYKEADEALKYSYLLGKERIIKYSQIRDREFRCPKNYELQYNIIADFVSEKSCDKFLAQQRVEKCLENYGIDQNASLNMVECFKFETVNNFKRFIYQAGYWNLDWEENIMELVNSSTLDEFREKFAGLLISVYTKQQEKEKETDICSQTRDYIQRHYGDNQLSLATLSKKFGLTSSYFSKMFKDKYQFSIPDYINITRINRAKELLESTTDSIQDIAAATGFLESNSFIRVFKKMEGITPGGYRSLHDRKSKESLD